MSHVACFRGVRGILPLFRYLRAGSRCLYVTYLFRHEHLHTVNRFSAPFFNAHAAMQVAEPLTFPDDGDDAHVQKVKGSDMTAYEEPRIALTTSHL